MTARRAADRHRTRTKSATSSPPSTPSRRPRHIAVVGAGMAGIACARTLMQAGHRVTVFEREAGSGGRMASETTAYGRFDSGAQYFTVRDARFARALETSPALCKRWSANAVRVLDAHGAVVEAALANHESHWVAVPGMDGLVAHWAEPLSHPSGQATASSLVLQTGVTQIERDTLDATRWQLRTESLGDALHVYSGFDSVLLAVPPARARLLLERIDGADKAATALLKKMSVVRVMPCWTLMLAFPQAQPALSHLGPQWNAARSTHHRVAWLARDSSKPGRGGVERWTLQASATWSQEHQQDDSERITAKLLRAFSEITAVRAIPAHTRTRCWPEAQTQVPLGASHLWDAKAGLGVAGDWCLGHRVEDAFVSGLSLALAVA